MEPPPRTAALVLATRDGTIVGRLAALPVTTPWWQDAAPVVEAFRARHGIEATILRLLSAELPAPPGGEVTYLAEVSGPVDAAPWSGQIADHPLRQSWAKPGGPAADLAWAAARLAELGLEPSTPAMQTRTWNLSSLWRLSYLWGAVWLKVVPPFFAHEGAILAHLAGGPVPRLLARDGPRMLLAEAPGEDLYAARPDQLTAMIDCLVELQRAHLGRAGELLALGLADARADALAAAITALAERRAGDMRGERARLARFVGALPSRLAAITEAGPGDTLVHGDFHPGNFRGDGRALTLLDWGDSAVGHPLLDMSAFLGVVPEDGRAAVSAHWRRRWREASPAMDFDRAAALIAPVDAARRAAIYQGFLDAIEPSERPYHAADPVFWLTRALDLAEVHDL
jgi:Ser/Thr protein kinase RdoA (MazF antagonist)